MQHFHPLSFLKANNMMLGKSSYLFHKPFFSYRVLANIKRSCGFENPGLLDLQRILLGSFKDDIAIGESVLLINQWKGEFNRGCPSYRKRAFQQSSR